MSAFVPGSTAREPFPPWELPDDALPVVLVVLDGLGDRAAAVLGGSTPAEAATTPVLDELARRGLCGVHTPFGRGRATSSERSHWAMFGMDAEPFPGRAALELAGVGGAVPPQTPMWHLALRRGERRGDATWIVGRGRDADEAALAESALRAGALGREYDGIRFRLEPLRTAEWVLIAEGARSHEVSDTDPLFEHLHPWMAPLALTESQRADADKVRAIEAARSAAALAEFLTAARRDLLGAEVHHSVPATKWASFVPAGGVPSFASVTGLTGAMVPTSALYRGLARLLAMREVAADIPGDLGSGVAAAVSALGGADAPAFLHVHSKATDEAGHTKDPEHKRAVIEALDAALEPLLDLADRAVVAVTGDHATPSVTSLLHSGDPTPLIVAGPEVRADAVSAFGEQACAGGDLGAVRAADLLAILVGEARRPTFLGHRAGATFTVAQPAVLPMPDPALPAPGTP